MFQIIFGLALILVGVIYIWKPTVFRRGIWMRTSIGIRTLSDTNYVRYMRLLGLICIAAGIVVIFYPAR